MRRSLPLVLLVAVLALSACQIVNPPTTEAPPGTDPPTTEAPPATDPPTTEAPPATDPPTTEAPPATDPPTDTTTPADEDGEAGEIPIWVWVLVAAALIGLGALLFRPRQQPAAPTAAPPPPPVAVIDPGAKADAYAEARWLADRLTADLGDFKAQLDAGAIPAPADTDARMQALNALGERTVAASNALYQAEASATSDASRSVVRATVNAVDGLRSSFDDYVTAAIAGDPSVARGQLDTARQVLAASLESLRSL